MENWELALIVLIIVFVLYYLFMMPSSSTTSGYLSAPPVFTSGAGITLANSEIAPHL